MSAPRLRFAPSPTGMFHVGGARTALFNWLYAERNDGVFLLRIEDTDEERNKEEWVQGILDAMTWLGLTWDEGPFRQSANQHLHTEAAQTLYASSAAYYCDCTREEVEARTKDIGKQGYDGFCRGRALGPGEGRALRFLVPGGKTVVHDLVRGDVEFDNANIEDFVIVRANGVPMYILANAVDDLSDRITHVVRGEEHLPNTPKQILLWDALEGGDVPIYAHLPVIVNEKRQKLSKRRDKVALEMYRDDGILPEAMRNYLALLGWAPKGDREIVSLKVLVDEFDFADVQKSPAFFDIKKLTSFNGDYIRALDVDEFVARALPFIKIDNFDVEVFRHIAPLVQERVALLTEVAPMIDFLFVDEVEYEEAAMKVMDKPESLAMLEKVIEQVSLVEWTTTGLHDATLAIAESLELKLGKAQAPIRLAVTGKKVGPPLFESLEILGRDKSLARLIRLRDAVT